MRADAATAGLSLVVAMVLGAVGGYAIGSLLDLAVPFGLIGLFIGLFGGLALVYARFKQL